MSAAAQSWLRFLLAAVLVGGTGLLLRARSGAEGLPARLPVVAFPLEVAEWKGRTLELHEDELRVLGDGEFASRLFTRSPAEPPVDLFLAYFPTQRTGSTWHSPQNCLPGAGWAPIESGRITLAKPGGGTMTVNRYIIGKGLDRQLVLYLYQAHGRVVASEYGAKFYLVADAIRLNRSDGALVRLVTFLPKNEPPEAAQRRVEEFARSVLPLLDGYIPP